MNEDLCFNNIIKHFYEELTFKCNLDKSSYCCFQNDVAVRQDIEDLLGFHGLRSLSPASTFLQ
jgi:hypothetical protein